MWPELQTALTSDKTLVIYGSTAGWAAWLSVWTALLSAPGGVLLFFKHGPLAFNGLLALWVPFGVFFVWMVAMTVVVIGAINREERMAPARRPHGDTERVGVAQAV